MLDTIAALAQIGSNSALRHASSSDLSDALGGANASPALLAAVAENDSSLLFSELPYEERFMPQISQSFWPIAE